MQRIFLIYGNPGSGKSTLAKNIKGHDIKSGQSFELISVDQCYVDFIANEFPALNWEALNEFIAPHYARLKQWRLQFHKGFGRDPIDTWHQHLLDFIKAKSKLYDNVVVEGYLLGDCKDEFEKQLSDNTRKIIQVQAKEQKYFIGNSALTLQEILKLECK